MATHIEGVVTVSCIPKCGQSGSHSLSVMSAGGMCVCVFCWPRYVVSQFVQTVYTNMCTVHTVVVLTLSVCVCINSRLMVCVWWCVVCLYVCMCVWLCVYMHAHACVWTFWEELYLKVADVGLFLTKRVYLNARNFLTVPSCELQFLQGSWPSLLGTIRWFNLLLYML